MEVVAGPGSEAEFVPPVQWQLIQINTDSPFSLNLYHSWAAEVESFAVSSLVLLAIVMLRVQLPKQVGRHIVKAHTFSRAALIT